MATPAPRRHLRTSPFAERVAAPVETYAVDDRVNHQVHGLGRVVSTEGDVAVTVRFAQGPVRVGNDRRLSKI
ncbi:hypothetical protein WDV85_07630 [Pseudokineococcus sp. 5B2Z-1]|uniref:hypothetical protein n=1 Tax=Pseudokineococcus sp. 5B2Z-1 TaxID=3132744 RepID=UPI0030B76F94